MIGFKVAGIKGPIAGNGVAVRSVSPPAPVWYARPYWTFLCWWKQLLGLNGIIEVAMPSSLALAPLLREFETGRYVTRELGEKRHLTPTGQPYVVLCGLGGEDGARAAFTQYAENRKGKLYWRVLPEVYNVDEGCAYYMRLFIEP